MTQSNGSQQLLFFNSSSSQTLIVSLSHNHNNSFNLSSLINDTNQSQIASDQTLTLASVPPSSPPEPAVERLGVVDENGAMLEDFEVGEIDPDVVENWGSENKIMLVEGGGAAPMVRVKKFGLCPVSMREYIRCLANVEAIRALKSTEKELY